MTTIITSLQNQRVKDALALRSRRGRRQQQRIIIDGARELRRAVDGGVELVEVFVCDELLAGDESRDILQHVKTTDAQLLSVTPDVFAKVAFGDRAEGIVGIAQTPSCTLADLSFSRSPLVGVVERIEKPGNLGAIVRSADGAGISALVAADRGTDLYNPNTIRASLGTIFTTRVCSATSRETISWLREREIGIYAASVDAAVDYADVDFTGPAAIVLGSEADGLSGVWHADDVTAITLPMLGAADSLNVSAAAAVLFYEALRQRAKGG